MNEVPIERLRELFNVVDGLLIRKINRRGPVRAGQAAGTINRIGYVSTTVDGVKLGAHRVVWAMANGRWPAGEIDHINGIRHDNRIENLRDVPASVNRQNRRSPNADGGTGLLGAHKRRNRFKSSISIKGRQIFLGCFDTADDAHSAYVSAKRLLHEGCTI